MKIDARKEKEVIVVTVAGRLDAITSPDFEKQLVEMISETASRFVVNLSSVDYVSSAGLRAILAVAKKAGAVNGKIVFTGITEPVMQVFKISGFSSILALCSSDQDALLQIAR